MEKGKLNRRQFLQLSAGIGGAALLAACAPKPAPTAEPTKAPVAEATQAPEATAVPEATAAQPTAGEKAKIQLMWRTSESETPMVNKFVAKFMEKNPDIAVEEVDVPWNEFEPKLMSLYAAGIAPDILGTGGTNPYVERYYRGMVLVLDPYLDKEPKELKDDLWPVGVKSYTKEGKLVALTFNVLYSGVFMNATRFDEAGVPYPTIDWKKPWTVEEMIETARKLTKDKDGDGKIDVYGLSWGHWSPWYHTRLWGQDLVSADDYASGLFHKWQTDKKEVYDACVAGLQARADAVWKHKVGPNPATAQSLGQIGPLLKTGAVAMEFTGGWALWGELPEEFKFRCATNPVGGVNGSGSTCKNTWADPVQIISKTKYPEQAWAFAKFLTVDDDAIAINVSYRAMMPAVRSKTDQFLKIFQPKLAMTMEEATTFFLGAMEQAETTVPDHILVGSAAARDIVSAEMDPVWNGEKTAKEAIDAAIPKVQKALEDNLKQLNLS